MYPPYQEKKQRQGSSTPMVAFTLIIAGVMIFSYIMQAWAFALVACIGTISLGCTALGMLVVEYRVDRQNRGDGSPSRTPFSGGGR